MKKSTTAKVHSLTEICIGSKIKIAEEAIFKETEIYEFHLRISPNIFSYPRTITHSSPATTSSFR